jgi:C-terminal processing protease CtpA/Prc/predicted Zn-dependent protease
VSKRIHQTVRPRAPVALAAALTLAAPLTAFSAASAQETAAPASTPPAAGEQTPEGQGSPQDSATADLVQRGNAARQAGRLPEAVEAYRAAAVLTPRRYEIRILLADTLRRLNRTAESATAYEAAAQIDPTRHEAYVGQALLRRAAYDFDGAAGIAEAGLTRVGEIGRVELLISLGETRRREGRMREAAELFARALAVSAESPTAHAGLAHVKEEQGDLDGAILQWDLYLKGKPDDAAADLRRTELKEVRAGVAAMRATAASSAGEGPAGAPVWRELARLLAVTGDAQGAAEAWRAALKRDGASAAAHRGLALALEAQGDLKSAAGEFRRVLRGLPDDGISLYHLVALARRQGDARGEEAGWLDLVAKRPDDLYAARACALFVGRSAPAVRTRALAHGDTPATPARLRFDALLLGDADDWKGAGDAIYGALRRDPTDPFTLDVLTDLLTRRPALLGELGQRATQEVAAGTGEDPVAALLLLARLTSLAGHDAAARPLIGRAATAAPASSQVHSALAEQAWQQRPDHAPALGELARAVDLDPGRLTAQVDLCLALLRSGHPAQAKAAVTRALERITNSGPLLSLLGAARADLGDLEGAAAAYAAALVADPADNLHLARSQYPMVLAGLGRNLEARRALAGTMPELPELAYLEAWQFARDTCHDRSFNGQSWIAWRDRFAGRLATTREAHQAIAEMLLSLGDPYTRLRDPEETAAVYLGRHGGPAGPDLLGRNRPSGETVVTGDLPGDLGYIQIANLTDPKAVAAVRDALAAMRGKEGLVIDLRGNTGGLTRSADEVADMLLGPDTESGTDVTPGGTVRRKSGGDGAIYDRPVTVLVDGQTASAAERLAASLEQAGRATLAGEPTFGKGLFQNARVLPGGHTVLVSAGEALGPDGQPIQKRGLRPQAPAPATPPLPDTAHPDSN